MLPPRSPRIAPAGLLVLCRRARYGGGELQPELLLALLWTLESCASQYRSLRSCLQSFLHLHPSGWHPAAARPLRRTLVHLQLQVGC